MGGPFTGRGKRITGNEQGGKLPKFTPGMYFVRVTKGVYRESDQGFGTFAGIETHIVKVAQSFTGEENAPYGATHLAGQGASWVFNLHVGNKQREHLALGNLNNIAKAIQDTEGFLKCLDDTEAEEYDRLLTAAEGGEDVDPSAYLMDLLVSSGGEKFAGLPLRVVCRDGRGKNAQHLFAVCHCYPVSAREVAEHFGGDTDTSIADAAAAKAAASNGEIPF